MKPFIPRARTSVRAQPCLHGETQQNTRQNPAEGGTGYAGVWRCHLKALLSDQCMQPEISHLVSPWEWE